MSRFFDFLEKSNGLLGTAAAHSGVASEETESRPEATQILSVLERTEPANVTYPANPSAIDGVAIQNVEIPRSTRLAFHTDPTSPAADRFRLLRMRLRTFRETGKLKSILITSPLPEDGKTTVALNLATALAEGGKRRVLLVEADLHHASISRQLGIPLNEGLIECLQAGVNPSSAIRRVDPLKCYVLTAGGRAANPTELLQTEALSNVFEKLYSHFDWIVIDSPPVIPLTDAVSLAHHADATLLVARAGRTRQEAIETAIALVGKKHILGIVLNGIEGLNRAYAGYAEYYRPNAGPGSDPDKQAETAAATFVANKTSHHSN